MPTSIIKKRPSKEIRLIDYLRLRNKCSFYNGNNDDRINIARNHKPFLDQLNLLKKLPIHEGCVNTIIWNKTGEFILSGGDDSTLCITKPCIDKLESYNVKHKVRTHHLGNIFSAKYLTDSKLVSCSHQGPIIVHDLNSVDPTEGIFSFNCHSSIIYDVVTIPDDNNIFLSCSDDKTVRLFDLRCHKSCFRPSTCPHPALIRNSHSMTTISIHPTKSNQLLVGRADGIGLVYDRRKLPDPAKFSREQAHIDYVTGSKDNEQMKFLHPLEGVISQFSVPDMKEKCRFTSLCYSSNGHQVLASYNQDYIYLFDIDKDSFELKQTLPKKPPSSYEAADTETEIQLEENSTTATRNEQESQGNSQQQTSNSQTVGRRRIPRIRLRGDWSNTGVDSVPSTDDSNQTILRIRRTGDNGEIMAGFEVTAQATTSNNNNDDDEDSNNRDTEDDDDDDDDDDEDDGNDGHEDEDDDEDEEDEEEGMDVSDDHEHIHIVEESDNNDNEADDNHEQEGDQESDGSGNDEERRSFHILYRRPLNEARRKTSLINSKTKLLFSNAINNLKSKYSHIATYKPCVKYQGHRNSRTSIKKAIFWGDNYIMSGSDCGRIMVWEKDNAKLIMCFPADRRVVNCLAPNPNDYTLASSGIDYDIKLWSTQNLIESPFKNDSKAIEEIVKNNEIMLEEARQTITVPPHLFFRVLATLSSNRFR